MPDSLAVILPPVLSADEEAQRSLRLCCGSFTEGDGMGCGCNSAYGWLDGAGIGYGSGTEDDVYCTLDGDGWGDGLADGQGDGWSSTDV